MKIGFIGSGNMATALVNGFLSSRKVDESEIFISDKTQKNLEKWSGTKINTSTDNKLVCTNADLVIFAVKPNVLPSVLDEVCLLVKEKIVVSIAAGVTLETLEDKLGKETKIIRAMPNTPAQVGAGMTVLAPNNNVVKDEINKVLSLFFGVGAALVLEEKYINVATALHGSSPAYVYMLIEAMANSGLRHGIPKDISIELSAKAVEGAARMVLETKCHPAELKDAVCSPGGTTIAAVTELEKGGFLSSISNAIDACVKRAEEMSQK